MGRLALAPFDRRADFYVARPLTYACRKYRPGELFDKEEGHDGAPVPVTRLKQMYDTRNLTMRKPAVQEKKFKRFLAT
jgi:hypothetical protein